MGSEADPFFDPWRPAADDAAWRIPAKRLKQPDAEALLGAITLDLAYPIFLGRLLALGRALRRTLPLEPLPDLKSRELLEALARKFDEARGSGKFTTGHLAAVEYEIKLFAQEFEPRTELDGEPRSYCWYVTGLVEMRRENFEEAARVLTGSLGTEAQSDARETIFLELLECRRRLNQFAEMETEAAALLKLCEMKSGKEYEIGAAHHYSALAMFHRGEWRGVVEAGRESNLNLFHFGAVQASHRIGVNTFLTAKGLAMQGEWGETGLLAGLSLRGLSSWTVWPTKGEAALLMAEAVRRFDRAAAVKALDRLLTEIPKEAALQPVLDQAEKLRAKCAPRPGARAVPHD